MQIPRTWDPGQWTFSYPNPIDHLRPLLRAERRDDVREHPAAAQFEGQEHRRAARAEFTIEDREAGVPPAAASEKGLDDASRRRGDGVRAWGPDAPERARDGNQAVGRHLVTHERSR